MKSEKALKIFRNTDILIAIAVIATVIMLIIPMPTFLLDFFIALNIAFSLIILLIVLYVKRVIEFSIFPTIILFTAIFRIALNVTSTRLILLEGKNFDGKIIKAFGEFVVGGNYVVGILIFLILIAVQIIVVTKGATRVSEVAARFALDALPGKQMEITNELSSGIITEEEAKRKKKEVQLEADFYGAMDGASKFVQGDVRVGIIITLINIIGGLVIGIAQQGMSLSDAAGTFFRFTVGDGLVSQIPSLMVSVATGVIVTRSATETSFGHEFTKQLSFSYKPLFISAGFLFFLSFLPGFPTISLWMISGLFIALGMYIKNNGPLVEEEEAKETEDKDTQKKEENVFNLINVEPMELEIGFNLVPLVDPSQGGDLLERIKLIRRTMALDLGLVVPPIRIRDNARLNPNDYSIKIKGIEVGKGSVRINKYFAVPQSLDVPDIDGEEGIDPVFNYKAKWITEDKRLEAERDGYSVVDSTTVVATHLTEVIRRNGYELLGRQEVKKILDSIRDEYSSVVDEVLKNASLGDIQKILQSLLKEGISIRNIVTILETIADNIKYTKNLDFITEKVRGKLGKQIIQSIKQDADKLYILTLDPELETAIYNSLQETESGYVSNLSPSISREVIEEIASYMKKYSYTINPVILTSDIVRLVVRSIIEKDFPRIPVISHSEISSVNVNIEHIGIIKSKSLKSQDEELGI
ncbi:MAG TPA: flagellar biosynthesis protein FlhA [Spirochaetota bacterium]|nr:flagellar biosynthesis protein FlhA [Spirochaetota bacterium]HOM39206.1 flagellar biosynthesis protein FlhA [Spirochaetota bacterium]HPQ49241.1 flagellar biosynthesis protein FlhA [Spirochaetota bacterium]